MKKNLFFLILAVLTSPVLMAQQAIQFDYNFGCTPFTQEYHSTGLDNPADWHWLFENGDPETSTEEVVEVTFTEPGYHSIMLVNSSQNDTLFANVYVYHNSAEFDVTISGGIASFVPEMDNIANHYWNFGDGESSNDVNVVHLYKTSGTFSVSHITNTGVCGDSVVQEITIDEVINSSTSSGCAPLQVEFSVTNSGEWTWNFGGGTPDNAFGNSVLSIFMDPGIHTVTAHSDADLILATQVEVLAAPEVEILYEVSGLIVSFYNNNTGSTFAWDFGDGQTSTEKNPYHTYTEEGSYNVTLTSTNECGEVVVELMVHVTNIAILNLIVPIDTSITAFVKDIVTGNKQGISNVSGQFNTLSLGTFNGFGTTGLGLDEGVILSTGNILDAIGPNDNTAIGTVNNLGSDPTLAATSNFDLHDVTYIEFDFVPSTNVIDFSYVFASEEYPEYVNTSFNDVFGFFISGPGISGVKNISMVPNTDEVVSINTVNEIKNEEYFLANYGSVPTDLVNIQFDGWTIPLIAQVALTPFETYHIKIAIGDASDGVFDSAVFLKANSFQSVPLVFDFNFGEENYEEVLFEDSLSLKISATLPAVAIEDIVYHFTYAGDAIMGEDYLAPETFVFPKGEKTASFKIKALGDNFVEGDEVIQLVIMETQDTLTITVKDRTVVGNKNLGANMVTLTPNPASDVFALPVGLKASSVEVYSFEGKLVKTFSNHFEAMNIGDLSKGMYLIQVATPEGLLTSKLKVK